MRLHRLAIAAVVAAIGSTGLATSPVSAHRSGCHGKHTCPSDHATYKWQGKLCVKPTSNKRTAAFKKKVRHAGLTYYCK